MKLQFAALGIASLCFLSGCVTDGTNTSAHKNVNQPAYSTTTTTPANSTASTTYTVPSSNPSTNGPSHQATENAAKMISPLTQ